MARKMRVEFEGATYHVMCRGDRRENIFEDNADRLRFVQTLGGWGNGVASKYLRFAEDTAGSGRTGG
jgi:hypothetical protein